MSNRSGRLGSTWERQCVDYLGQFFPWVERRVREGAKDRGDITGIHGVVFECKNEKRIDLPRYLREAAVERDNDGARLGIVLVKQRSKGVASGYFVMSIEDGVRLLRAYLDGGAL